MMVVAMVLITFNVVFWTLFEQAGSSLTLFADRNTELSVFGLFTLSAPQTQNFNPLSIVIFAPIMTLRSEEHTSELQSLMRISYAVFCLKKKKLNPYTQMKHHPTHT